LLNNLRTIIRAIDKHHFKKIIGKKEREKQHGEFGNIFNT
jgi:hypothetical protein